ncbi:ABC transporter ATP-binding protein [Fodinibius halophilus]|uniref:ABC transporter ATP-binding protein n=1 Tax=Fodinibius halophilus TaxID=1736908 RepID=A0A6M1SZR5_9BACT|nr:ABC transporter ATP-binding protein [Fodinibius halophilus]NGP87129.1 ABC transporter ATP-binding protein [Fodinibius halophilus]
MIQIEHLKKVYNNEKVLDIPQLVIPRAECFGLVGNNGAGKTTLFRLILDLIRPSEGTVFLEGDNVRNTEEWKNNVGAYLDEHMLLTYLTASEYFDTLRSIYGLSQRDLELHLQKFEELFNGEIIDNAKYIRDLSKGNLKKVGIAAAMLGNKNVVILDEPFENLDPSSQSRLKKLITKEKQQNQVTYLISSHDLVHVTDVCNRIVILEKGIIKKDLNADKQQMTEELDEYFRV